MSILTEITPPAAPTPWDGKAWGSIVRMDTLRQHRNVMPMRTNSHCPIPHDTVLDLYMNEMWNSGFVLSDPVIYLSQDPQRARMYAGFGIAHRDLGNQPGLTWQSMILNSHDKSRALTIGAGHEVAICSNGMMITPLGRCKTKHTRYIQERILDVISEGVNSLLGTFSGIKQALDSFKATELDPKSETHRGTVDHILGRAWREDIINPASVKAVWDHWMVPEHPEFARDCSVDRLYQAFTSADRGKNAFTRNNRQEGMFTLLAEECGTIDPRNIPQLPLLDEVEDRTEARDIDGWDAEGFDF